MLQDARLLGKTYKLNEFRSILCDVMLRWSFNFFLCCNLNVKDAIEDRGFLFFYKYVFCDVVEISIPEYSRTQVKRWAYLRVYLWTVILWVRYWPKRCVRSACSQKKICRWSCNVAVYIYQLMHVRLKSIPTSVRQTGLNGNRHVF